MQEFHGKVAVITGAASGIGRAIADRFAKEGMKLVLADVETEALDRAVIEIKKGGAEVKGVVTDVSKSDQVAALADAAYDAFGEVHILCNNAGVGAGGAMWNIPEEDWAWVLGVNLWGVIHGIRAFVPRMLEQNTEGHIVNTASMAGLSSGPGMSPYFVSKHGVVTLSEGLHYELKQVESKLNVSVLCPAWVNTGIADSDRNRPAGPLSDDEIDPMFALLRSATKNALEKGKTHGEIANCVLDAVHNERFYILPHQDWKFVIETRMQDILDERPPTYIEPPGIRAM